jgi:hypothetical protein
LAMSRLIRNPYLLIETWYLAGNCIGPHAVQILCDAFEQNTAAGRPMWAA